MFVNSIFLALCPRPATISRKLLNPGGEVSCQTKYPKTKKRKAKKTKNRAQKPKNRHRRHFLVTFSAEGATPKASDRGAVRLEIPDFEASIRNRCLGTFLRSKFNKAESLRNPVSKESASEDASIASYSDFESDRSAVGRLRRRAFGENFIESIRYTFTNVRLGFTFVKI